MVKLSSCLSQLKYIEVQILVMLFSFPFATSAQTNPDIKKGKPPYFKIQYVSCKTLLWNVGINEK